MAGVLTAGLFATEKGITYTDSAKLAPGAKPEGAVFTFVDPADPAVAEIAQAGYHAIDQVGTKLVNETTRELAAKDSGLLVVPYLYDMGFNKFELGFASAIAMTLFLIIFVVSMVQLRLLRAGEDR